ncbi:MAG: glycosyltransferase [Chlamydiales bacterium]|nr:glycosyltransferase [Chlamydiales bacterium]
MRIVYPYNEILPKKKAHDLYIFDECAALAGAGFNVTLLCGRGGMEDQDLFRHYAVRQNAFHLERIPIVRKNNLLNLCWNTPFFFLSQRAIRRLKPDWVFLSVCKQGAYHLRYKIPGCRYLYEVHELAYYPHMKRRPKAFSMERDMLARADLITVTTDSLKKILLQPPYSLTNPIEVLPLAAKKASLPPPPAKSDPLILMFIGQLYAGQGVEKLISALALVEGVHLKILGGRGEEILRIKGVAAALGIAQRVDLLGFVPPAKLSEIAKEAHAFIAPFECVGRMPYVAHTKLYEYAQWGRPIVAPDLPSVREHFSEEKGALLFEPDHTEALAESIRLIKDQQVRSRLQEAVSRFAGHFSWEERATQLKIILDNSNLRKSEGKKTDYLNSGG